MWSHTCDRFHEGLSEEGLEGEPVVAFLFSVILAGAMIGVVLLVGKRRAPGTPLTWGEAFVAGVWVFALLFVIYGVVPHQWLSWADNALRWRSDKIGLPLGPFGGALKAVGLKSQIQKNLLFPNGIPLPNGHFIITAQALRDIVAAVLYGVFLVGQIILWLWWQNRGKKPAERPALVSAYGRPLVRKV